MKKHWGLYKNGWNVSSHFTPISNIKPKLKAKKSFKINQSKYQIKHTNHLGDQRKLISGLLDKLLDLAAPNPLFDRLPVVLLLTNLQPVLSESLYGFSVPFILGNAADFRQRFSVQIDEHFSCVGNHFKAYDPCRFLYPGEEHCGAPATGSKPSPEHCSRWEERGNEERERYRK